MASKDDETGTGGTGPGPRPDAGTPAKPDWALSGRERRARARAAAGQPPRRGPGRGALVLVLVLVLAGIGAWIGLGGGAERLAGLRGDMSDAGAGDTGADPAPDQDTQHMQLLPSELLTIEPGRLRETVKATGSLSPARHLALPAEVSARVTEVSVRAGEAVAQGDLLVRLDVETLRNQLDQQRATAEATWAQLRLARTQLERTRSLMGRGLTPQSEVEAGQANVDQLAASLAAQEKAVANAEENLAHARVSAPFAGTVSSRSVEPGTYVTTGTELLSLVDLSSLDYEAAVPVRYAPLLAAGQAVELSVEGLGDRVFTGRVDRVGPVAIEGTRMLPVYVLLDNPDGQLRGGMFAAGRIVLEETDQAIGIPVEALREDGQGRHVLKLVDDRVMRQPVSVARTWSGGRVAEISGGLVPGDRIVALPLDQLRPGARVTVVEG